MSYNGIDNSFYNENDEGTILFDEDYDENYEPS